MKSILVEMVCTAEKCPYGNTLKIACVYETKCDYLKLLRRD
jgi:hypothetical protein